MYPSAPPTLRNRIVHLDAYHLKRLTHSVRIPINLDKKLPVTVTLRKQIQEIVAESMYNAIL